MFMDLEESQRDMRAQIKEFVQAVDLAPGIAVVVADNVSVDFAAEAVRRGELEADPERREPAEHALFSFSSFFKNSLNYRFSRELGVFSSHDYSSKWSCWE